MKEAKVLGVARWLVVALEAARHAALAGDQCSPLKSDHHLVQGRPADPEQALHVGLGRRTTIHQRVSVNEGKVLPTACGEDGSRII
jgi:hypothetical protein